MDRIPLTLTLLASGAAAGALLGIAATWSLLAGRSAARWKAGLKAVRAELEDSRQTNARQAVMAQRMALVAQLTSNGVIVTDRHGCIEWVNEGFTRLTGYRPEDALGRTPGSLLRGPDTDPAQTEIMRHAVRDGTGFCVQLLNHHRAGRTFWLDVEAMPVRDAGGALTGFIAIQTDISGMRQALADLARSAALLRESQAAAHIGGWEVDCRTGLQFWTEETYRIHEADPRTHQPTVANGIGFYHPESLPAITAAIEAAMLHGTPFNLELRLITTSGRVTWVRAIGQGHRQQGVVTRVSGSFQDISGELAIRERMAQALASAQAADRAKTSFLAMMSHEIRTPMNGVMGMAALLDGTRLDEEQRGFLSVMTTSGELLLAIIDDILDFSKVEAGHLALDPVPVDLHLLVGNIVRLLQPTAADKHLDLQAVIDPGVPAWIVVDGGRLRQVLINLIGNALKFTRHGGVVVRVRAGPRIDGSIALVLEVSDTGIGIPVEVQDRLFQPFFQAEGAATTRVYGGTGLGLAICRRLVELMRGTIAVRSRPDHGSTFTVSLSVPQCDGEETRARMMRLRPMTTGGASSGSRLPVGRRALVAEDNDVSQMVTVMLLKSMGYQVTAVGDGEAAVAAAHDRGFDVILMDCLMPVMDGWTATRTIRAGDGPNRRTRVIALTAGVLTEDRAACLAAGMDEVVAKPVLAGNLRTALSWPAPVG